MSGERRGPSWWHRLGEVPPSWRAIPPSPRWLIRLLAAVVVVCATTWIMMVLAWAGVLPAGDRPGRDVLSMSGSLLIASASLCAVTRRVVPQLVLTALGVTTIGYLLLTR